MKEIIFATHNENKVKEIRALAGKGWHIISLYEAGMTADIPEPYDTLEGNARQKSETIFNKTKKDCFSEDTGLEVFILNNAPGVHSARFAGPQKKDADNLALLLKRMKDIEDRAAQFRTVISFISGGEEHQFEGICKGQIAKTPRGEGGFGYDPVFIPEGAGHTFAEMSMEEKSRYSHRSKAFRKFISFLKN